MSIVVAPATKEKIPGAGQKKSSCFQENHKGVVGRVGFEPTNPFKELVLQTSAFNHSAIYPCSRVGRESNPAPLWLITLVTYPLSL